MILRIMLCLIFGYIFGCFSTGYFIGKYNRVDIRKYGSGNVGMTNALRTMGAKAGALTLAGDFIKAVAAILLVKLVLFPEYEARDLLAIYTGLGVVIGHNYPFWLKFKGGKGIAATSGVMATIDPLIIPIGLPIFLLSVLLTKYVSVGSLAISILFPIWIAIRFPGDIHMLLVACVFTVLAFIRHKSNIKRLMNGTENKIGQRVKVDKQ